MSWPFVTLGSICNLVNGYAFKSADYVEYSNTLSCRMSNIRPGGEFNIDYNARYLPDDFKEKHASFLLKDGDVIIAMTDLADSPKILGVPTVVKTNGRNILLNQRVGKLEIIDSEKVFFPYLKYALNDPKVRSVYKRFAGGGLQINLGKNDLLSVKIPLPPLETQKQIAAILEKADQLRKDCQQMEQELNSLAQSVFIDMFGDPVSNPKGWKVKDIGSTFEVLTDYHANGSYEVLQQNVELLSQGYALMVRTTDLEKNNFVDGVKYISEHAYNYLKKTKVYGGEMIVNKIGSAGKLYLMPELNRPVSLAMNQFMVRFNPDKALPVFMYHLLSTDGGAAAIKKKVKGAVTKTIRKDALREIQMPIPPIDLQTEFCKVISKQSILLKHHHDLKNVYEANFNALMQKAFKGELNLDKAAA